VNPDVVSDGRTCSWGNRISNRRGDRSGDGSRFDQSRAVDGGVEAFRRRVLK